MIELIFFIILLLGIIWIARKQLVPLHLNKHNWNTYLIAALQALGLSIQVGSYARRFFDKVPQTYSDFISGGLGFANQNKSAEFYTIYTSIIAFIVLYIALMYFYAKYTENPEIRSVLIKISLYGLTPFFVMLGQSLRMPETANLLLVSSGFVVLSIIVNTILLIINKKNLIDTPKLVNAGIKLTLICVFLALSEVGAKIFLTRSGLIAYKYGVLTIVLGIAFLLLLIVKRQEFTLDSKLNHGVLLSQLGVPLLFSTLFAPPAILKDGSAAIFPYKPILMIIFAGFVLVSFIDIYRRFLKEEKAGLGSQFISPWAVVAILIFFQSSYIGWPSISPDEYHSSEFYSPWWLFKQFGYLPFVDFVPARGLVNYVPGFLAWLFYDNTFASQVLVLNQFAALYIFLAYFAFRMMVGDFIAFLMVSSVSYFAGFPTGGIIIAVASLVILYKTINHKNYVISLWIWLGLSCFAALFYIAEGSAFVLSTLPFALWLTYQSYLQSKKSIGISIGILGLGASILIWTTKLGLIGISAVRYLIEQAGVNDVAHGIAWQFPTADINQIVTSGYLWQVIRFSWLLLLIPISVLLIRNRFDKNTRHFQFLLIAVFIFCILLIPRAAGRIDAVAFSRPGLTSIGIIACALPLVIIPIIKKPITLAVVPLFLALIFGLIGNQETQLRTVRSIRQQLLHEPASTVDGESLGLANLGTSVIIDANQLQRQIELKSVIDQLLKPAETYYDATNHSLDYGLQGRPSPVTDLAPYNIPSEAQQMRVIDQLESKQIPLVLVLAENIYHDGGVLSLRNYWIYDYLQTNFIPFSDEFGRVWMVRNGEEHRLKGTSYTIGDKQEQSRLSNLTFWQKYIAGIPAAWGNSTGVLLTRLTQQRNILEDAQVTAFNNLQLNNDLKWETIGPDPSIVIRLPQNTSGDMLYLEFEQNIIGDNMQLFWLDDTASEFNEDQSFLFTAKSSKYLIPVSSAPSWNNLNQHRVIRIDLPDNYSGVFRIDKLYIYDRTSTYTPEQ